MSGSQKSSNNVIPGNAHGVLSHQ
uniref:Uncharacterized protein n=1 Tax=Anguilla anguilla TaxID=7936 RepID=A0A0E9UDV3_ANGAN